MGENPSNFYNDNIKYANPPAGGCNWDLDYYRTNYINAIMLGQLKNANYIKSGLVPTQGVGLNVDVTAGVAVINGTEFTVGAFSQAMTLAPIGGVEFNCLYIDYLGSPQVVNGDPAVPGCALAIVDTDDTAILRFMDATQKKDFVDQVLQPDRENLIVDGDFIFWHEAISQTSSGYGSDTMWKNSNIGTTKINSRQSFAPGQTEVPGGPKYYSSTAVSSVAGSGNLAIKTHIIEDVRRSSGKKLTLSFYAKADSAKDMAFEFYQNFGTGGSPSGNVTAIGAQKVSLTTVWQKFTATVDIPSIAGKTLGTDGNHYLVVQFWFDAGSDWNTNTDSLGQQSGTFDMARVRLVEGETDGDDINLDPTIEEAKVSRYFKTTQNISLMCLGSSSFTNGFISNLIMWETRMRSTPSMTVIGVWTYASNCESGTIDQYSAGGFRIHVNATAIFFYVEGGLDGVSGWINFDARQ